MVEPPQSAGSGHTVLPGRVLSLSLYAWVPHFSRKRNTQTLADHSNILFRRLLPPLDVATVCYLMITLDAITLAGAAQSWCGVLLTLSHKVADSFNILSNAEVHWTWLPDRGGVARLLPEPPRSSHCAVYFRFVSHSCLRILSLTVGTWAQSPPYSYLSEHMEITRTL